MPSDFSENSSLPQIPFQFGDFQQNDFASFLTGENKELLSLLNTISKKEERHRLYLWGAEGFGKTHLLQAACKQASEFDLHVAYLPLKQLSEFSPEMLHDLGELDLVCVDDIECVAGEIEWQQGLVWLYNELRDNEHSMIISANVSATNIELEVNDLKSRLSWDQVLRIKEADDELKIQILKQKANARSFDLSDEVIEYLIVRVDRDLGSLIDVLYKIDHASLSAKRKITIPFVKDFIN
jgi:DnaA-homolog protein